MEKIELEEARSGADLILDTLLELGISTIFGYPGGAVLPLYDAIYKNEEINHILSRHEQGSLHEAEGYAKSTGKLGVALVTSGPGATNAITGIADAMSDSVPLLVFTGQVATSGIGKDAFQEANIVGITMPITKYNYQIRDTADIPRIIREAVHIATTGRPGPVVIDLPKDVVGPMAIGQIAALIASLSICVTYSLLARKIDPEKNLKNYFLDMVLTMLVFAFIMFIINYFFVTPTYLMQKPTWYTNLPFAVDIQAFNQQYGSNISIPKFLSFLSPYGQAIFIIYFPFNFIKGIITGIVYYLVRPVEKRFKSKYIKEA